MSSWQHKVCGIATACAVLASASCASVPKEVVQLSYRMGQDLESVHSSYMTLIHAHFESLRQTTIDFVDYEWAPVMLKGFVATGQLVDIAKGIVVMSNGKPVRPDAGKEEIELLDSVGGWARAATRRIDKKKADLLKPINDAEITLTSEVNLAFDQLNRGNATITAHLNSLRKVQEAQDEALEALQLKGLRDTLNDGLVKASDLAAKGIEKVRETENVVKQADAFVDK
jgi:hypothetical protein